MLANILPEHLLGWIFQALDNIGIPKHNYGRNYPDVVILLDVDIIVKVVPSENDLLWPE